MNRLLICLLAILSTQRCTATENFSLTITCPAGHQKLNIQLKTLAEDEIKDVRVSGGNGRYIISGALADYFSRSTLVITEGDTDLFADLIWLKTGEMNLQLKADRDNAGKWMISQSNLPFGLEANGYERYTQPVIDSLVILGRELRIKRSSGVSQVETDKNLSDQRRLRKELIRRKVEFVKTNYDSYFSLYIFRKDIVHSIDASTYLDASELVDLYALMPGKLQQTKAGVLLKTELDKILSLQIGQKAPAFAVKLSTGNTFRLSDFRDSLVLLCFWDSYCQPCIASFPALRSIDSSYSAKGLKMISVSIDNNESKWKNSLERFKLPWAQACDLPQFQIEDNMLKALYRIRAIPQYFLIDRNGKIVYHNDLSKDDKDYSKLKNKILENL